MPEPLRADFTLATLTGLRRAVERHAARCGLRGVPLYRFVVAAHEVAVNAVRHGGGSGRLELWRSGSALYCRITDDGGGGLSGPIRCPPPDAASGRGMWLARNGTDSLLVHSGGSGTAVTLLAHLTPA
ncbi:anti-sigma regulatory factor (Ser/Thr protein kinase) [Catenuloplanes nepalensis]|uniref:Anti-sigma regulatory factor (Ser/Thr protein kinase) n=1 Tax=Catenuloplanes nepalensis TaxID=587533 RepID=A0ABT9N3S7_9ACTN|nr:ATP-binding protein [Catenuloplanes nepalensis]MDP9798326.1 anti-sigma regulatory factor (Ser/Thr protein kinase) [Catenuloplanes nepalensis]